MILKNFLAGVLACCVMSGALPSVVMPADNSVITASAEDEYTMGTEGVLEYRNYDDHIEIADCDESAKAVVIPAKINGLPVTSIGYFAFYNCSELTEITIPDSVTSIGHDAFENCTGLTEITIPDSVTNIDYYAFYGCSRLTSINIPNRLTSIGALAFSHTPWLENKQKENPLVIVNGILIDGKACSGNVVIPNSIAGIGDGAFAWCTELTEINIPDSVTSIGEGAFLSCEELTEITIPYSVTSIDEVAFLYCTGLTKITILNPNCKIYDSDIAISTTATIYGYDNSTAQAYAEKYGRKFVSLGEASKITMGDVNGDDSVDSSDATNVLADYSLTSTGKKSQLTYAQKIAADVDKDGKIDASDASYILGFYAYTSTGGKETDMSKWMTKQRVAAPNSRYHSQAR